MNYPDITEKDFCVWGTGTIAKRYYPIIQKLFYAARILGITTGRCLFFVDKNDRLKGELFFEKSIVEPYELKSFENVVCVIAVENCDSVRKDIQEISESLLGVGYFDYLYYLNQELIKLSTKSTGCINELCDNNTPEIKQIIRDLEICNKTNFLEINKAENFCEAVEKYGASEIISSLAFFHGYKSKNLFSLNNGLKEIIKKREIKTIGIYYRRFYNGGVEKILSMLMPLFISMGYKVVFVTDEYKPEEEYELPNEVNRINLNMPKYDASMLEHLSEMEAIVRENNIDVFCFHGGHCDRELPYEIILMHTLGIPVLFELHGSFTYYNSFSNGLENELNYTLMMADTVVTLSDHYRRQWKKIGLETYYIQNPIERIEDTKRFPLTDNTLLWVGRIDQDDNQVLDIVPIMKEIICEIPDARLVVVGSGNASIENELDRQIKENGLSNNIIRAGYQSNVIDYYRKARILLVTINKGGFPTILVEAKQIGIPIVAYDIEGIELLNDHGGYLSVGLGDTEGYAKAVVSILSDKKLENKLSIESKDSIGKYLDYNVGEAWAEVFDKLVGVCS